MKVGLWYLGGAISSDDIGLFKELMAENSIEFREHDSSGEIRASLDDITGVISIFLGANLITTFVNFVGPNAAWDAIKFMTEKVWRSTREEKYSKITPHRIEEKDITFSVSANLKTDNYYFKIDGMKSPDELNAAMDKVLTYLDQQKSKIDQHKIYAGSYDSEKGEWIVKDFLQNVMEKKINE